jgi:hypothetical protein
MESGGTCTCTSILPSGTASACPAAPTPTCCLDQAAADCSCSYGTVCASTAKVVASCTAADVEAVLQAHPQKPTCSGTQRAVDTCGPISQSNPLAGIQRSAAR